MPIGSKKDNQKKKKVRSEAFVKHARSCWLHFEKGRRKKKKATPERSIPVHD